MIILIVGKDSYIGSHLYDWLTSHDHQVRILDVLNDEWKSFDYSHYDAIVHVAGIVHRPDCNDWNLYKRVNTDMPISIASMAKTQGVRQFIFFSTMGVYGVGKELKSNVIEIPTPLVPESMYGKSKLLAEEGIRELQDEHFKVVCVRPPSVYGKGCRGGYISGFISIVRYLPAIPCAYENVKQSFIYIDNLCELIRLALENNLSGDFCPQDDKAVSAIELLEIISNGIGKRYRTSRLLGLWIRLFNFLPIIKKVYGGVEYSKRLSSLINLDYVVVPFDEAMRRTVAP